MRKPIYFLLGFLPVVISRLGEFETLDQLTDIQKITIGASCLMGGLLALQAKRDNK